MIFLHRDKGTSECRVHPTLGLLDDESIPLLEYAVLCTGDFSWPTVRQECRLLVVFVLIDGRVAIAITSPILVFLSTVLFLSHQVWPETKSHDRVENGVDQDVYSSSDINIQGLY